MRNYQTLYFLLFVLLVMGAFASMAQNRYGMILLGIVAGAFGLLFVRQFFERLANRKDYPSLALAEPAGLAVLSLLLGMRIFHLRFPFVEVVFVATCLVLAIFYLLLLARRYRQFRDEQGGLAGIVVLYYLSIVMFLVALAMMPLVPAWAGYIGVIAFLSLLICIVAVVSYRQTGSDGVKTMALNKILEFRDRSVLVASVFGIMAMYMGLTRMGVIPPLYSDEYPQAYYRMVNDPGLAPEQRKGMPASEAQFREGFDRFVHENISGQQAGDRR